MDVEAVSAKRVDVHSENHGKSASTRVIISDMLSSTSSVLERLLGSLTSQSPLDFTRQLLNLDFSSDEQSRYQALSEKAQLGTLSEQEKIELDDLLTTNDVLTILQSKARASLGQATAG